VRRSIRRSSPGAEPPCRIRRDGADAFFFPSVRIPFSPFPLFFPLRHTRGSTGVLPRGLSGRPVAGNQPPFSPPSFFLFPFPPSTGRSMRVCLFQSVSSGASLSSLSVGIVKLGSLSPFFLPAEAERLHLLHRVHHMHRLSDLPFVLLFFLSETDAR